MTEKSQLEQNAAQRQSELLAQALEKARTQGGAFLNPTGKTAPRLYPNGTAVSAFNALMLALHSDQNGYRTNLYTPFPGAKKRGEGVQAGEKGVPFVWYRWNEFQSRTDNDQRITRVEYNNLSDEQKKGFAPVRDREIRTLFNIEQTTLPLADKKAFEESLKENGTASDRGLEGMDDKKTHIDVNIFLQKVSYNLVPIRKDGTGMAHYDAAKDVIHLPPQKDYASYVDYVQEAVRQIVSTTGHPQRLGRPGTAVEGIHVPSEAQADHERLVVELATAVKMNQLGLPARLSPESMKLAEQWEGSLKDNPRFLDGIEADVNNAIGMIDKAERGVKVEKKPMPERKEAQSDTINASVSMVQDDEKKWALFIKPDGEKGFAVYPDKNDVGRYFASAKQHGGQPDESLRQELAQKYFSLTNEHPEKMVDLFKTKEKDIDLSDIQKVSIVRLKEEGKILCYPEIKGIESPEPREVSPSQWQRLWLSDDKVEYKRNLAATLFADILRQKQQVEAEKQQEEKRQNSPEQKAKEEREEKAKEALTRAETGAVAGVIAGAIVKQEEEEHSRGFHR